MYKFIFWVERCLYCVKKELDTMDENFLFLYSSFDLLLISFIVYSSMVDIFSINATTYLHFYGLRIHIITQDRLWYSTYFISLSYFIEGNVQSKQKLSEHAWIISTRITGCTFSFGSFVSFTLQLSSFT